MKEKLKAALSNENGRHIFPFFWQHGEDDETLLRELHRIYDCGIRSVCVESRPHEGFGTESWYEDMRLILAECKRLGMEFWLLDDKHFPTGYANGLLMEKYPHLGKRALTAHPVDVAGPVKDGAVMCRKFMEPGSELIAVVACERIAGDEHQSMTGRAINLTENVDQENGMVFFHLPEGHWRIFTIFHKPCNDRYIDMLREESVHVLIEAVYEPHYQQFSEYFGTTFRGYFSDEPFIMQESRLPLGTESVARGSFPWNENVRRELAALCPDWITLLPNLWFPGDNASKIRVAYMEAVTRLYEEHFSWQLGNWCRAHRVEYIGHIVEDAGFHTRLCSGGHYFRALDGQDMAGIDVVLCQIVPGMGDNTITVPCHYQFADHKMFHYTLAKLGASHSHIQPLKKGRAMCEIYGAYGWAEGLPMMKWLTDHMLVRGINHFVPHAFSPKYPDDDCPPHFYAGGRNPEYHGFGKLMGYTERVAGLLSDGRHHASAAILYHAQAEWSGQPCMKIDELAKVLTQAQLDFDIIPEDYLEKCTVENGLLKLNQEEYRVFIVPYARMLPKAIVDQLTGFVLQGLPVWFVDGKPERTCEGDAIGANVLVHFQVMALDKLPLAMRYRGFEDLTAVGENTQNLRVYHYSRRGGHALFVTNEGIHGDVMATLRVRDFAGGEFVRYDPMENRACRDCSEKEIVIHLPPYGSEMLLFGALDLTDIPEKAKPTYVQLPVEPLPWRVSTATPEEYTPGEACPAPFDGEEMVVELYNIVRKKAKFSGFVRYETELTLPGTDSEAQKYRLDLGRVGEVAYLWVNGEKLGEKIVPPYCFEFTAMPGEKISVCVVTTSHLGYEMQDCFSAYLSFEPVGLLGPVTLAEEGR